MSQKLVPAENVPGFMVVAPDIDAIRTSGLPERVHGWCVWRAEARNGQPKPAKIPRNGSGAALKVNEPGSWIAFEDAAAAYADGGFDGVGLLMGSTDDQTELTALDLDDCLNADGTVTAGREQIVADFVGIGGYVEVSPSGRGLRQFVMSVRLDGYRQKTTAQHLEVYSYWDDRYVTVTGRPYGDPRPVVDAQENLEAFIRTWCEPEPDVMPPQFDGADVVDRDAQAVLKLLRQNNKRGKIIRLLSGETPDYAGHSEADAALCTEIAYYTRNPATIDAIFRTSGLMRDKWDRRCGRGKTYGSHTIERALEFQARNYDSDQGNKADNRATDKARREAMNAKAANVLVGDCSDLRNRKGGWRTDLWALSEQLVRDRRLLGACCWDEFAGMAVINLPLCDVLGDRSAPNTVGRVTDDHLRAVVRWFGREWSISLRMDQCKEVVASWAQQIRINPVVDRLNELADAWDGKPRLDDWLISYCRATATDEGGDISDYVRGAGSRWLIGTVARAFKPGCKMDVMLVLEGRQGARKSSAVRVLFEAVGPEYFREGFHLGDGAGKDERLALRGRLGVEWGELSGLGKKDRNELKTFLAQQFDSYRDPYGITERDWPRTCVFCGTTNDSHYLSDPTGNRRFWPVTVGRIDLDRLKRDAPQIWGEAVCRYRNGERWWFDDADPRDERLLAMAHREQARRLGGTLWEEIAADLADKLVQGGLVITDAAGPLTEAMPGGSFSVRQMRAWLGPSVQGGGEITDTTWLRVTDGLKRAGWESRRSNGRMVWFLTPERRDELARLRGEPEVEKPRRCRPKTQNHISDNANVAKRVGKGLERVERETL